MRRRALIAPAVAVAAVASVTFIPTGAADHTLAAMAHWDRVPGSEAQICLADLSPSYFAPFNAEAVAEWDVSPVIHPYLDPGCIPAKIIGVDRGETWWLGYASISSSSPPGDTTQQHIWQAEVGYNLTLMGPGGRYHDPVWFEQVSCHEIGHAMGMGHQDVTQTNPNLGSCMDYSNDPDGGGTYGPSNLQPNAHDYEMLSIIYAHNDGETPSTTQPPTTLAPTSTVDPPPSTDPTTTTTAAPTTTVEPPVTTAHPPGVCRKHPEKPQCQLHSNMKVHKRGNGYHIEWVTPVPD